MTTTINSDYKSKQRELVGTYSGETVLLLYCRKWIHDYNRGQFCLHIRLRCCRICHASVTQMPPYVRVFRFSKRFVKRTPFIWNMTPCHWIIVSRRFEIIQCIRYQGSRDPSSRSRCSNTMFSSCYSQRNCMPESHFVLNLPCLLNHIVIVRPCFRDEHLRGSSPFRKPALGLRTLKGSWKPSQWVTKC